MKNSFFIIFLLVFCGYSYSQERLISIPSNDIQSFLTEKELSINTDGFRVQYELEEFDVPKFPIQVDGLPYAYPAVKYYKAKGKNALISVYNNKDMFITEFSGSDIIRVQPYGNQYKFYQGFKR